jgi:hypothetical protein
MVFFAKHMLETEAKGEYADIMERELYNGILSGMQLDGKRFFYVNPLEVVPGVSGELPGHKHVLPQRPRWYGCACCPPNIARLLTSLGGYAWSENEKAVYNHLYIGGSVELQHAGGVKIVCETNYPWEDSICYTVQPKEVSADFTIAVRIPAWSKTWTLYVNGQPHEMEITEGYAYITRCWFSGDEIRLTLCLEPRRVYANTHVRANAGCVALMRGPLVYCIEEGDNGENLSALRLPRSGGLVTEKIRSGVLRDIIKIKAEGVRLKSSDALYSDIPPESEKITLHAIPYYAWGNREKGGMRVWIPEC